MTKVTIDDLYTRGVVHFWIWGNAFGSVGSVLGWVREGVAPSGLGGPGYYRRKIFEILSAKSCDLVHILCCNCQYNSTNSAGNALVTY